MKKKYLILTGLLFAWMGAQPVSAQTDVTAAYLTNPSFEADGSQSSNKVPTGWTLKESTGGYTTYKPMNGSKTTNGDYTITDGIKNGATDGDCFLHLRTNWDESACVISQTTATLPVGRYTLKADVFIPYSHTVLPTFTLGVTNGGKTVTETAKMYHPLWRSIAVSFDVEAERSVEITLSHTSTGGSGAGLMSVVDNLRLVQYNYFSLSSLIGMAESLYDSSAQGASEFNSAIETAQTVSKTASIDAIASAINTLEKAVEAYKDAQMDAPSESGSSWVTNASLETTTGGEIYMSAGNVWNSNIPSGWKIARFVNGSMNTSTHAGQSDNGFEVWGTNASETAGLLFQTIPSLPTGKYTLSAYIACQGKLFAKVGNDDVVYSQVNSSESSAWNKMSLSFVKKNADDVVLIGGQTTAQWVILDEFSLTRDGSFNLNALKKQRDVLVGQLQAYEENVPSAYYKDVVSPQISTANSAETEEALLASITVLEGMFADVSVMATIYEDEVQLEALCQSYISNSMAIVNEKTALGTALEKAISDRDNAMTLEKLAEVRRTLEAACQAYMLVAQPKEGYSFDLTFKINNAAVASTDGWTDATTSSGEQYDGAPDNTYLDRGWNGRLNATQVIANLPAGKYTLKAATRSYNPNNSNIYVEHDGTTDRTTVHNDNNTGGELGNGWSWTEVPFTLASGDVKIGFYADCGNNQWAGADDFHLTYAGVADAFAAYEAQKNLAQPLLASKMNVDVRATVTTLCGFTADNTRDELLQAMFDLKDAVSAAEASIAAYAYLQREVATAKSLGLDVATVEGNIAAESYTTEAAIAEAQAQNVAVYNKVKKSYTYEVPVEGWTGGDIGTDNRQHWSGIDGTSYYDTNGWDFNRSLTTTVTLPAGEYVLMAAGRSRENATMELKIDDTTVRFTAKGDTGYGIETSGQANFSENGTYANGGTGRGWEWEYVHLKLTEEKTVNLSATIATIGWGWGSFSDITLKMDQATFEAVYYKRLQIALEECKPWNEGNTYADTTYPGYKSAYNDKTYTTVEEIEAAITALKAAFDAYAQENASAEHPYDMTSVIENSDCIYIEKDPYWLGDGRSTMSGEHWSGDVKRSYLTQNHENGSARYQAITLKSKGAYLLKTSVRVTASGAYAIISLGVGTENKGITSDNVTADIRTVHGRVGGTIATDGTEWESVAAGLKAGKQFANDNNGFGWVYNDLYFSANTDEELKRVIYLNLSNQNVSRETDLGGMKLYYLGEKYIHKEDGVAGYYGMFGEDPVALTDEVQAADVTQAAFTSLTLNRTNPNGLVYAKAGQLTETENVIVDGTCANLVLADGHPFAAPKAFTATKAAYNMKAVATTADGKGFGTLCLPFEAITLAGQAYKLDQGATAGGELYATKVTTVPANTPVLVTAAGTYSAENASVAAVKATDLREGGELVGVYAQTQAPVGSYVLQKHTDKVAFYPVVGVQPTVKPFRAYIRPQGEAASYSMLSVVFGFDEETAIETVETAEGVKEVSRHDAAGVRISRPQKGLNIIRMSDGSVRKVIIK
ncbi:MAG: hypothetical protein J6B92_06175 [Paraprevotella sp.]|nr:hypothetical protein [Paraprevotella sp.]